MIFERVVLCEDIFSWCVGFEWKDWINFKDYVHCFSEVELSLSIIDFLVDICSEA